MTGLFRFLAVAGCLALVGWCLSGCATFSDPDDSEIPWNAPQPWEGNLMHGMGGMGQF